MALCFPVGVGKYFIENMESVFLHLLQGIGKISIIILEESFYL
jgi:hypothetical protein